ncbi:MAG: chorismate synthase [Lachnospiraceae bacterium]|nr:chorismate synthase [Lachnospiraceae bacterium]
MTQPHLYRAVILHHLREVGQHTLRKTVPYHEDFYGLVFLGILGILGFEIGDGFAAARAKGSENNDAFVPAENGGVTLATNHAGGILGGISNGAEIIFRAAIKPTPSISSAQETVDSEGKPVQISIKGRHDPVIVPRAVIVVKAMAAIVLADAVLASAGSRMDKIKGLQSRP